MDSIYIPLVRSPKRFTSHYYPDRPLILAILWAIHRTRTHCWHLRHQTTTTLARRPIQLFEATSQMSIARSVWYKYLQRRPRHTLSYWQYRSTVYSLVPMTDIRLGDRQPTSDAQSDTRFEPGTHRCLDHYTTQATNICEWPLKTYNPHIFFTSSLQKPGIPFLPLIDPCSALPTRWA